MLVFWIAASILIAIALALVLPALMVNLPPPGPSRTAVNLVIYRERRRELEAEHAAGHIDDGYLATALIDVDRELLRNSDEGAVAQTGTVAVRSPYSAILVTVLLPLVAIGIYLHLGTPEALLITHAGPRAQPDAAAAGGQTEGVQHSAQEMVARLEQRLRDAPENADGWLMLGRSYGAMNRLQEAREALARASRKRPDHPLTLVSLAEVMARLQGDRLDGEPIALVERALVIEPNFPRGLWLAGMYALDRGDPARARVLWQRLLTVPGLSPQATSQVREAIARAAGSADAAPTAGSSADQKIIANVTLSPELVARVEGSETLYRPRGEMSRRFTQPRPERHSKPRGLSRRHCPLLRLPPAGTRGPDLLRRGTAYNSEKYAARLSMSESDNVRATGLILGSLRSPLRKSLSALTR